MQASKVLASALLFISMSFTRSLNGNTLNDNGRSWLLSSTSAKAACLLPYSLGSITHYSYQKKLGLSLFAAGGSYFTTYFLTENVDLGYGRVAMMNYGGTLGFIYPLQLKLFLHYGTAIDDGAKRTRSDGSRYYHGIMLSDKIQAWATFFTFPYGIYAGFSSDQVDHDQIGDALVISYMSQTLGAMGYLIPYLFFNPSNPKQENGYFAFASLLTMGLIPAGFTVGSSIINKFEVDAGRGILLYVTGFLGTLSGYAFPLLFESENHFSPKNFRRFQLVTTVMGYTMGTSMAFQMQKKSNFTIRQSLLIGSSTVAGLLIGAAVPSSKESHDVHCYARSCVTGAWLGFMTGNIIAQSIPEYLKKGAGRKHSAATIQISVPALINIPVIAASRRFDFPRDFKVDLAEFKCKF